MSEEILLIVREHGFPMLAAVSCGYFIFLILKFILHNVMNNIKDLQFMIVSLESRTSKIDSIVNDIDVITSKNLGIERSLPERRKE